MAAADPRRARWTLRVAGAVFAVGTAFALLSAVSALTWLRTAADARAPGPSEAMARARGERQADFVARFDHTRVALASAGWALGPADGAPRFECWVEQDESVCALFAHTEVSARVPPPSAAQVSAVDELLATTSSTLAEDGWACSAPLARGARSHATCAFGETRLDVAAHSPATVPGKASLTMELHLSQEAYRSDARGDRV